MQVYEWMSKRGRNGEPSVLDREGLTPGSQKDISWRQSQGDHKQRWKELKVVWEELQRMRQQSGAGLQGGLRGGPLAEEEAARELEAERVARGKNVPTFIRRLGQK